MNSTQTPTSLRIVAWIFLLSGLWSLLAMAIAPFQGRITLSLGVLGIPIFFGLLHLRNGWRICALIFLWIGLIFFPIYSVIAFTSAIPIDFKFLGASVARIPGWLAALGALPFFLLALWQYRVLTGPRCPRPLPPAPLSRQPNSTPFPLHHTLSFRQPHLLSDDIRGHLRRRIANRHRTMPAHRPSRAKGAPKIPRLCPTPAIHPLFAATLHLPAAENTEVTESGTRAPESPGIDFEYREANRTIYTLGSGSYVFNSTI